MNPYPSTLKMIPLDRLMEQIEVNKVEPNCREIKFLCREDHAESFSDPPRKMSLPCRMDEKKQIETWKWGLNRIKAVNNDFLNSLTARSSALIQLGIKMSQGIASRRTPCRKQESPNRENGSAPKFGALPHSLLLECSSILVQPP